MTTPHQPDVDAEREVDLARWRRALVALWWIPVAGLVAGAIFGVLYSFRGGATYKASALISLGPADVAGWCSRQRVRDESACRLPDRRLCRSAGPGGPAEQTCAPPRCAATSRSRKSARRPAQARRVRRRSSR